MEKFNVICALFILELVVDFLLAKSFHTKINKMYLLFLQVPKICINLICLELIDELVIKLVIKFISEVFVVIFLTESFNIKTLAAMIFTKLVLLFSVGGCFEFLIYWIKAMAKEMTGVEIVKKYHYIIMLLIIVYIMGIFALCKFLDKNKKRKDYLAKLSLKLNGVHMCFSGLIDSGNSLKDNFTKKPVILISKSSMLKYFSIHEVDRIIEGCRNLKCNTVTERGFNIKVTKINKLKIESSDGVEFVSCVIGFVDEKFENGRYDCLLPRDYL